MSDDGEVEKGVGDGVDLAFRAEVKKALGTAAVNSDREVSTSERPPPHTHTHTTPSSLTHSPQDSDSEASLDDDAMMAVDEALAAVFRTRRANRPSKKQKKGKVGHMMLT